MKTKEQLAEEYGKKWNKDEHNILAYDSFLAGYDAALAEVKMPEFDEKAAKDESWRRAGKIESNKIKDGLQKVKQATWFEAGARWQHQQIAKIIAHKDEKIRELEYELKLAIAHDRQPYPTAEAYNKACESLNNKTDKLQAANLLIDELEDIFEKTFCKCKIKDFKEKYPQLDCSICKALEKIKAYRGKDE